MPAPADAQFASHAGRIYVLSDGMGGHEGGAAASLLAVRMLVEAYRQKTVPESIPEALLRSVRTANEDLYELARRTGADAARGMGATIVAAVIRGDKLYWTTVGDSRLFLFRNGQLARLNQLHRYGDELDERMAMGDLSEEEAGADSRRHMLMSYLGLPNLYKVDCPDVPLDLRPGDRLILCSDGLTDALTTNEIAAIVSLAKDPNSCAEALTLCVREKKRAVQDNTTVIVAEYQSGPSAAPPAETDPSSREAGGPSPGRAAKTRRLLLWRAVCLIVIIAASFGAGIAYGIHLGTGAPAGNEAVEEPPSTKAPANSPPVLNEKPPDNTSDHETPVRN